jgi:elongation factor G
MNFFRLISGELKSSSEFYNANKGKIEKISQISLIQGKKKIDIDSVSAGDIAILVKLKETATCDTITSFNNPIQYPKFIFPEPIYSLALIPKSKQDQEKLTTSLNKLIKEDPSFKFYMDKEFVQTIISGMGDLHLNVITEKLKNKFNVEITTQLPQVPYRETFKKQASAQGKYKKQTGGHGQYGDVWLEVKPLQRNTGFQFIDKIVGGAIPKNYIPSVEKGVKDAINQGILAGFPLVDISVTIYDGTYHPVDSSDMAFQIAGSFAVKSCAQKAGLKLLEPIYEVVVEVPTQMMGDIMSDLSSRRGKIIGTEIKKANSVVKANVPYSEMLNYINDLKSITGGRGYYSMKFAFYDDVPAHIQEQIIKKRKEEKEAK